MNKKIKPNELEVSKNTLVQWQSIVDILAKLADIPAALIMRIIDKDIEVFLANKTEGNPYHPGNREHLIGSGRYCETVVKTKKPLLVPDALADSDWRNNPDVKEKMISYLGFPIMFPGNTPFGTLCILDNKANAFSETIFELLCKFRDLMEWHLGLLLKNAVLDNKNQRLSDYLDELQSLRGLISICSKCKKIKDIEANWHSVEKYLIKHPDAEFSHGYCPDCLEEALKEIRGS